MLSFQKLRVYQRSIQFLALVVELIEVLSKDHADLADQLLLLEGIVAMLTRMM